MCRWMGLHIHNWIARLKWGYIFITVPRMGSHSFGILGLRKFFVSRNFKKKMCELILGCLTYWVL